MKYDILSAFREYLYGAVKSRKTADRYYFAVDKLLSGCQFDDLAELSSGDIEAKLEKCSGKANFSAAKNGLLHLKKFDGSLSLPSEEFFAEQSRHKRNRSKKPAKTLYLDTTNRKINAIKDKKLKLAYRLMLASGLRVNEAAQLTKDDILINGENITVNVLHGKGGSNGTVECMQDPYLAKELPLFLEDKPSGEPVFYAQSTMRRRANELGLECHDLRRIAAITYRKKQMGNGTPVFDANSQTKSFLRHARFSTTKRYLFNRKLKYKMPEMLHNENDASYAEGEKISKSTAYAINPAIIESRAYADKFDSITAEKGERREFLKSAKEILHHRSGQNGEDLYLYNRQTKKLVKSTAGTEAGTPEYTEEIKSAIQKARAGELISFHNHPSSMPPSADDLNAAKYNGYFAGYALCHNGKIFEYTPPAEYIDNRIYTLRIANYKKCGYNEYAAQWDTMKYLSELFGFSIKEVL